MMPVAQGDTVTVAYTGTLDDGSVFDSSEKHDKPLVFTVGKGMIIPGFEQAIVGMEKGQEKEITLEPKDAYGDPNPALKKQIPRDQLPKDKEVKPGMVVVMSLPNGQEYPAQVIEVADDNITVDLNHPLAGKTLHFKLKVEEIQPAASEAPKES